MNKIATMLMILIAGFLLKGCDFDQVLSENARGDVTQDSFFGPEASEDAVEQYINGIYSTNKWGVWDRRYFWFTVVPADGFRHTTAFDAEGQEYDNHNFNSGQFNVFRMWNYTWWPVGRSNGYLANHDQLFESHGDSWTKLNRFKGEALFFRAYWHFFGVQAFGEIPLALDAPAGSNYTNSTYEELYGQIIQDLEEIINNNYLPNWQDINGTADEGRITSGAAKTTLCKVYLTRATSPAAQSGDFQQAADWCMDVMQNEGYRLITEPELTEGGDTLYHAYEKPFLDPWQNGPEGIYEYQFLGGIVQNRMNREWHPQGLLYTGDGGIGRFIVSDQLWNSYSEDDLRRHAYFAEDEYENKDTGEIIQNDNVWMIKYRDIEDAPHTQAENNFVYLRYADVLLMYAEAVNEANNGPTQAAYDAINEVRNRAGLDDLVGLSYEQFRDAIREERYKELAGEGWRFWDLRRWGYDYAKQRIEAANLNANVEEHEMVWPIPDHEVIANPEIQQNPGY